MDLKQVIDSSSAVVATATFLFAVISARRSWDEKRLELERTRQEKRLAEVRRLLSAFADRNVIFSTYFDYSTDFDSHLRIDNLRFTDEELATRSRVDAAFEHLRDLFRSLKMGLIEKDDLSFWTYWIHRIPQVPVLMGYATACGYQSFLSPLREASKDDSQLRELAKHCPWWPKEERIGTV